MAVALSDEMIAKLETKQVIWFTSVRQDGRPHLAPIWFVWHQGKIFVSTGPNSVKAANIRRNPRVALALEDGEHPVICEGMARPVAAPLPEDLLAVFYQKYEWDITRDTEYNDVIEITPEKWLGW